ncbi:MAG TPA: HAD-IIA family hydrolase [Solirubrobacterales bacterium]|jgi:HAD superfamily hydrolase (TIGR01450 family)|nr:HAD-IIA family hydrolase [Solirubrobacterales bacterium]
MALADEFDGFLVDLDGVVWVGREAVPGSAEALVALQAAGKRTAFVTNNPGRHPARYAERLRGLGIAVEESQIVTAGIVVARMAAAAADGGGAFVIGAPSLHEMVAAAGAPLLEGEEGRRARVVVVSGHRGFDYGELLTAKLALDGDAALLATSHDPTMPMPGGEWPGTGAVLAAVEVASGHRAEIAGKPERHLFEIALEAIGRPPRVAMVGDRVSSDIAGGRAAGLATVLVLSGTTSRAEAETAEPRPDHVVENLAALLT